MKPIIIYNSQTGFTKQYAQWLAEALGCPCIPFRERNSIHFDQYDTILFGSWWHAGALQKKKWFLSQVPAWEGKRLLVFAVGAMPPQSPSIAESINANFSKEEQQRILIYYLPGGLCYEKMGPASRLMMKMFASMMAKKNNKTPFEEEMARVLGHSYDLSDPKYLTPLLEALQ
ncbi:MAG: flavodoxin domain-containing protein [Blautia sp.]|jgi:menaquinone-dependent protoporphyrinogen IX oxidase